MLSSSVYYLTRKDEYRTVKPYALRYIPEDGIPQTIIEAEKRSVVVKDIRSRQGGLDLDRDGFTLMPFDAPIPREVFSSASTITSVYVDELAKQLKSILGATHVEVLDYVTRRRLEAFPAAPGAAESKANQPFPMAHIDMTVEEAERSIRYLYGDNADVLLASKWQILTAWKPVTSPVKDWPLALCDPSTVDYEEDVVPCDIVFENHYTENGQIHFSENHEWLYVSEQRDDEVLIFKTVDINFRHGLGPPHAALPLPEAHQGGEPRESIDCRVFVSYAQLEDFPKARSDAFNFESHF